MSKVSDLIEKCQRTGMSALAITDHGNMFGIKELFDKTGAIEGDVKKHKKELAEAKENNDKGAIEKHEKFLASHKVRPVKPIIGVEAYCARRSLYMHDKDYKMTNPETSREQIVDASGHHLILLAKNLTGYHNLCHMVSVSWVDGNYYRPRIDKELLKEHKDGLIVCSACLGGEIPQLIIAGKTDEAEQTIMWFKELFGDDYYLEIQRHKTDKPRADYSVYERQQQVNKVILELAKKTNTKVVATNDVHFVEEEHGEAHDRLICLSTGKDLDDDNRMHYTKQEWLKTPEEMAELFSDIPEVLENTMEIADKVELYNINHAPIMPMFDIPEDFGTEEAYREKYSHEDLFKEFTGDEKGNVVMSQEDAESKIQKLGGCDRLYRIKLEGDYLHKLTMDGAKMRYGDPIPEHVMERLIFELHIMKTMGFPGYFLIVQDFIAAARGMGVSVGPGRGSAAGSVVAYCLKITDVDPLKYDLLFERFLNPDRISLPDIDIDFDDDGRGEVLRWVTEKYGKDRVAHIVTYGTMATKSAIKDVGRVQKVELSLINALTKMIPDKLPVPAGMEKAPKMSVGNCVKYLPELSEQVGLGSESLKETFRYAEMLEGTVRNTGVHACGIIIGADDLKKFAPLSTATDKDTKEDMLVTQYEGSVIESVGLIKMDFLGLKTLSIIKEAVSIIKQTRGIDIDMSAIPIDDEKTYQLYSEGRTVGTFQFESAGMQKYLRDLKPTVFEDLIAMNALYRPGPMDYIPQFIARKHGREPIVYDIDCMDEYLKDTYGITVYQEQVMLLARKLADFTRGESDTLRKAMGKKMINVLNKMKSKFITQGQANGHDPKVLEKIWGDWEKFASYAFNKSHATCYSWVAYQTAYLKANYPAELMAANLTCNKNNIADVTKFMEECVVMNLTVNGPNVNESMLNFTVNKEGNIVYGLAGVKGVGEGAAMEIINERERNGKYKDIYDFMERINLSTCNRKAIESLVYAGGFDCFEGVSREQFFAPIKKDSLEKGLDVLMKYAQMYRSGLEKYTNTLFGDLLSSVEIDKPILPKPSVMWSDIERLKYEKDMIGIYLSAHPLDGYKYLYSFFIKNTVSDIARGSYEKLKNQIFRVGGIVTSVRQGTDKTGAPYLIATLEDFTSTCELALFRDDFKKFSSLFLVDACLYITGVVEPSKYDPTKAYMTIKEIAPLSTCLGKIQLRGMRMTLKYSDITLSQIEELKRFIVSTKEKNLLEEDKDFLGMVLPLSLRIADPETLIEVPMKSLEYWVRLDKEFCNYMYANREIEVMTY
jgi:DNA polymerase-3 subunit alpha